jgi:3-oxoacyl-[acyl-carrier protein] reductase
VSGLTASPGLDGKRILVTGSSRGIGRAVAVELARHGASLALVARSSSALEEVLADLGGGPHCAIAMDARDEAAWSAAVDEIAPAGRLDAVVTAAAALTPIGPIGSWSVADFRATLDLNVTGTLLAIVTCLDALKAAQGSIVTFSGGGATAPFVRFDAYAASKVAVVRLTENLAIDLRGDGIRANSIAPGFVVTPMHNETVDAGPDAVGAAYYERTTRAIAEGSGDPPTFAAELATFLCSDESRGITGKLLSARWDPWRDAGFQQRLRDEADLATLRRIDDQFFTTVPKS